MTWPSSLARYRASLTFALRLTIAALLALLIARLLAVRLPLWVVLTAMIVTQTSLGRSLKVALDYFAGTLLGALWGGLVVMFLPHASELALYATLALALVPLAFVMAVEPRYATAPITAAIVLLMAETASLSPMGSVVERLIEVGLGGLVGLFVSVFLLPSSAFQHIRDKAADALDEMAKTTSGLVEGFAHGLDVTQARSLQLSLGPLLGDLQGIVSEAEREKGLRVGAEDAGSLLRSLLRLRHDLVMIGRAVRQPLPAALFPAFAAAGQLIEEYFKRSAASLRLRQAPPQATEVDAALLKCTSSLEAARRGGELRDLSTDQLEHLFAMDFALAQMRRNFVDLDRCINEWAT
ncbi:MAG: FUSC family protein [Hyphomicrobium sp.]|nr:FUSC family protein [Hyphomicrobium sp.]